MTSKISLDKVFKTYLSQNLWLFAVAFAGFFFILTMPSLVISFSDVQNLTYKSYFEDILENNDFVIAFVCFLGIFFPIFLFKYLNSKSEVDFYHSLPIKREKLFAMNYMIGILYFALAYIINTALSVLITATSVNISFDNFIDIFRVFAFISVCFLAIYALSTFAAILTGNGFMTACLSLGLGFLYAASQGIYYSLNDMFLNFYVSNFNEDLIFAFSPYVNIYNFMAFENKNFIYPVLIFIAMTIFAVLAYKIRPSENSKNAVAIDIFKPIIKTIGTVYAIFIGELFLTQMFGMDENLFLALICGFIVGFIVHVAFEMMYDADFKSGFRNLHHFAFMYFGAVAVTIAVSFDITGYDAKLPKYEKIESVTLSNVTYTEQEAIDSLYDYAERSVLAHEMDNFAGVSLNYYAPIITFTYENGDTFTRQYLDVNTFTDELSETLRSTSIFIKSTHLYELDLTSLNFNEGKSYVECFSTYYLSSEQAKKAYDLIVLQSDLVDAEYLSENMPIGRLTLCVQMTDSALKYDYYDYFQIPIYPINTLAIDYINEFSNVFTPPDTDKLTGITLVYNNGEEEVSTYVEENIDEYMEYVVLGDYDSFYTIHYSSYMMIENEHFVMVYHGDSQYCDTYLGYIPIGVFEANLK